MRLLLELEGLQDGWFIIRLYAAPPEPARFTLLCQQQQDPNSAINLQQHEHLTFTLALETFPGEEHTTMEGPYTVCTCGHPRWVHSLYDADNATGKCLVCEHGECKVFDALPPEASPPPSGKDAAAGKD